MAAETTTFLIDMMKTRLQLHGQSHSSARPASAFGIAADILRREGLLGLYKGLTPAIIRHLFYTPIRIVGYEHFRNAFVPIDRSLSLSSKALIGGVSDVIAQNRKLRALLIFVKVRGQADGRMVSQGLQTRYSGPFDALNKILLTEGFLGLWSLERGLPKCPKTFLVYMGELSCYDHAECFVIRNHLAGDNIYAHTLASIMSGFSATALRMMNQTVNEEGKVKYRNSYDCLVRLRLEGLQALWKGWFHTWARLGPWQFVF